MNATDDPADLGPQDYIFVALKAHSIPGVVDAMQPLISNRASVVTAVIQHIYGDKFPLGEPSGEKTERVQALSEVMERASIAGLI